MKRCSCCGEELSRPYGVDNDKEQCDSCWEDIYVYILSRLDSFLRSQNGLEIICQKIVARGGSCEVNSAVDAAVRLINPTPSSQPLTIEEKSIKLVKAAILLLESEKIDKKEKPDRDGVVMFLESFEQNMKRIRDRRSKMKLPGVNIREGKVKKGGVNEPPTTPRPEPPKGQGGCGYCKAKGVPCPLGVNPDNINLPTETELLMIQREQQGLCKFCGAQDIHLNFCPYHEVT